MSAATNQSGVFKGGVKRSSGPISRIPGGERVAVKVGVVQMEKVNDQKVNDQTLQCRWEDEMVRERTGLLLSYAGFS